MVAAMTVDLFGRCADYDEIVPGLEGSEGSRLSRTLLRRSAPRTTAGRRVRSARGRPVVQRQQDHDDLGRRDAAERRREAIARARYLSTQARQPVDYYEHVEVGYNYRLSNVLAALGRAQLTRFDEMIARRRAIRRMYVDALGDVPGVRFLGASGSRGATTRTTAG